MRLASLRHNITIRVDTTRYTVPKGTIIQASDSVSHPSAYLYLAAYSCTIPGYPLKYNLCPDLLEFLDEISSHPPEEV